MTYKYQIRVRLIVPHNNKLLLEHVVDEDFYFYPGGRVGGENLYPVTLTEKLASDFHEGFPNQGEYLGAIK